MNKKAQGLSLNVIIIAAIALIVLVILSVIFIGRSANEEVDVEENYEEWDYKIYDEFLDFDCLNHCNINTSDCQKVCKKVVRKMYGNSYCNISCGNNTNLLLNITVEPDTAVPAQNIDISQNCNYTCYGEYKGMSY